MKKILIVVFLLWVFPTNVKATEIQQVVGSKSGVKAWLVEDHHLPLVAIRFAFEGGSEQDPIDKQGLSNLTMDAVTEGAGSYSSTDFQKELADHSIRIGLSAERDVLAGGLKCLSEDKDKAFEMLHLALTSPRFELKDIERLRAQQLAGIKRQFGDPEWQARYALFTQIYKNHPYGERHLGSARTLASITRADIKNFAAQHLARDNVTVAVAGDMSATELASALDKIFAGLPAHAKLKPIADVQPADTASILVHREGTQTDLLFEVPGPKRNDPLWYAADIANYILGGGGFASRLMQEIRDKRGLTYGIDMGLSPSEHNGIIAGEAAVDNPNVAEVLQVLRETMQKFRDDGATAQEISAAKDYLTGSKPLALTSTDKIAEMLVMMQREKLGRDYLDRYSDIVRGVSAADIDRAIERWFDPDQMTLAMVGDPVNVTATQKREMVRQ